MAGLFLSGLVLMFLGGRAIFIGPDCSALSPAECALERDILLTVGRRQVLFGGALALLVLALFIYVPPRSDA